MGDVLDHLRGALAARYTIDREIGRGGMATVYRAQDLKHRRAVALKVLKPELAAALGPDRFLREIEIAAGLTHPHVLPLYDSGDAAGLLYYVMPFVEGETLRGRLDREHQIPLDDALRITREVADALDYAHGQGLVHRDVKPENVLFVTGHAVLSDFGIARAVTAAAGQNLTQGGIGVGTPRYMSPEQAFGAADVDARSDVYSLACVLYEMLAGNPPFNGPTVQAIIAQSMSGPPPRLPDGVPDWTTQAVRKALAKEPADRFPTAGQFALALKPEAPSAATAKSIAVLPFVNMSADPDNEYFTDGIAEEIINALTKVHALRVAARTSAFAFKGKTLDIRRVGEQLNVSTVLEGSVRKAGNRLRVMAQLINVADGYHLWSERYDRELEDVFAIQDEIAGNIVRALRLVLSEDETRAIEQVPTANVAAYDYYLRGRQYFHQYRRNGIQFARRMFERAIEMDPRYAIAYAGVADCCSFLYLNWDGSKANLEGAETASRQALALGPELADAHASRGFALSLSRKNAEARQEFDTALRLNPKLYEAHYLYARMCISEGTLEEAVRHYEDAARVRPEDYQAPLLVTSVLQQLGRPAEANEALRRGLRVVEQHLELNPDDARALCLGAASLVQIGERARALEWTQRARDIDPEDSIVLYNLACAYGLMGEIDQAISCLEKAVKNGYGHKEWLEHDSYIDALRPDARFQALLKKL
jgi:TolB-like protein/Flp pilus assembly protein TadD/tRNA A-37 threonylcarbamoyl transferase component Bud32